MTFLSIVGLNTGEDYITSVLKPKFIVSTEPRIERACYEIILITLAL